MRKKNCKGEEHDELPRDPLRGRSSLSSTHQSSPSQLHCVNARNVSNHRHRREMDKAFASRAAAVATTGNSENRAVSTDSQFV
jgi:hypothetical protein